MTALAPILPTMNVAIAPDLEPLVTAAVADQGFGSAEAVVDYALRHLLAERPQGPEHEAKLQALRAALAEGDADIAAGRLISFASEQELVGFVRHGR